MARRRPCRPGAGGGGDVALRCLGLLMGLITLGVLWFAARRMGGVAPLLGLALFALAPEMVRRGTSVRAYGLGGILVLLAVVLMWEMIQSPTPRRVVMAALVSVLSVHTLYYNSVLLLVVGACASGMALRRRMWKRAMLPLGIGLAAGASFLPYLITIRELGRWNALAKSDVTWAGMAGAFRDAMGTGLGFAAWIWPAAILLALAAVVFCQVRRWSPEMTDRQRDTALYFGILLVAGTAAYALFLRAVSYGLNPWYFYAWMGLVAICADGAVGVLARRKVWTLIRIGALAAIAAFTFGPAFKEMHVRMTNVDSVAAVLNREAVKGDLIVLNPWTWGITFNRYYHGPAEWVTVPDLADHRTHRYDLVLARMKTRNAVGDIQLKMEKALRTGHRVWILGWISIPRRQTKLPPVLPVTDDPRTWKQVRFLVVSPTGGQAVMEGPGHFVWWSAQLGEVVARGDSNTEPVKEIDATTVGVHPFEQVPGTVIWGWRDELAWPER